MLILIGLAALLIIGTIIMDSLAIPTRTPGDGFAGTGRMVSPNELKKERRIAAKGGDAHVHD